MSVSATRPELNKKIDPAGFESFYWEKKELIAFCSNHKIPTNGGKIELTKRIAYFLKSGEILKTKKIIRVGDWDSSQQLTRKTQVINYRNDAKTRDFFLSEIGDHFHFNSYLRQFGKTSNKDPHLSYGDLVDGWKKAEDDKKLSGKKTKIGQQFKYNQFQRDFYAAEKGKSRNEFNAAWKLVRSIPGDASYADYLKLKNLK